MYNELSLFMAHAAGYRNLSKINSSSECGCFYCLKKFPPSEIKSWADKGETALCPYCGMDSVLGSASGFELSEDFLSAMKNRFFKH